MKILHVSFATSGGAGRAAARVHRAQRTFGLESRMLVARRRPDDDETVQGARPWFRGRNTLSAKLEGRLLKWGAAPGLERSLNLVPSRLHREINASDADVVNLHWVNGGLLSIPEIGRIRKPIVWTLHDMWPFAGAEHYAADGDERWRTGYPLAALDGWTWHRKRRHWRTLEPVLVAPSRWLAERSRASVLFHQHPVRVIPNPIDRSDFQPRGRALARAALNLPADRAVVLFGAHDIALPRKGVDLLIAALARLVASMTPGSIELVVFGHSPLPRELPVPARHLGWLQTGLDAVYSAADLLVVPSRVDNLPNTAAEAAACGLPTVAFRLGGLPDLIDHRRTGYLAEPLDVGDLARGMTWVLSQPAPALRSAVRDAARALAPESVVPAYLQAYRDALDRTASPASLDNAADPAIIEHSS